MVPKVREMIKRVQEGSALGVRNYLGGARTRYAIATNSASFLRA